MISDFLCAISAIASFGINLAPAFFKDEEMRPLVLAKKTVEKECNEVNNEFAAKKVANGGMVAFLSTDWNSFTNMK